MHCLYLANNLADRSRCSGYFYLEGEDKILKQFKHHIFSVDAIPSR